MTMNHVMLDLETWARIPGAAIRSIGAVQFDLKNGIGRQFYLNITDDSCREIGLIQESSTVKWWSEQSEEAKAAFNTPPPIPIRRAIDAFHAYFEGTNSKYVWSHGAAFDVVLWETACRAAGVVKVPWKFQNVRDTRTVHHLTSFNTKDEHRLGTYHNAQHDALHQAKCIQEALKSWAH